eukprot:1308000-Alexandrium_andersonii.AAC.1
MMVIITRRRRRTALSPTQMFKVVLPCWGPAPRLCRVVATCASALAKLRPQHVFCILKYGTRSTLP